MKYIGFGDKQLIFCIDSDADYLLENPILQIPFVFHTYVDMIENYWSYADGLADVFKKTTNSESSSFDFVQFFETYSKIVYPYLLCSLFSTKEKDGQLSHKELGKHAKFVIIKKPQQDLSDFKQKLEREYSVLLNQYKGNPSFESFKQRLTDLGLTEQNAYLFVRGHDVFEGVFMPLMQHLGRDFDTAHFKMLPSNQEKAAYQKSRKPYFFDVEAQNNPKMMLCTFYQRIVQDIQTAFQN